MDYGHVINICMHLLRACNFGHCLSWFMTNVQNHTRHFVLHIRVGWSALSICSFKNCHIFVYVIYSGFTPFTFVKINWNSLQTKLHLKELISINTFKRMIVDVIGIVLILARMFLKKQTNKKLYFFLFNSQYGSFLIK